MPGPNPRCRLSQSLETPGMTSRFLRSRPLGRAKLESCHVAGEAWKTQERVEDAVSTAHNRPLASPPQCSSMVSFCPTKLPTLVTPSPCCSQAGPNRTMGAASAGAAFSPFWRRSPFAMCRQSFPVSRSDIPSYCNVFRRLQDYLHPNLGRPFAALPTARMRPF